ncbi:disease resistance protein RUN1 [Lathyrus oleraceus]|nr:disease resistance protein RUN1-like [Pisum sativum]
MDSPSFSFSLSSPSPSSLSSISRFMHDVFINFKREDTSKTFVSDLDVALSKAGIESYIDYHRHNGTDLDPELLEAIEEARISIIVFSKNYAESSWCLNELERVMECRGTLGQFVVPVFYDVNASDVRHQKGDFGKVLRATAKEAYFRSQGKEKMKNVLSNWSNALTQAANLSGLHVSNYRYQDELVQQIVESVMRKLKKESLFIALFPVGLESYVQEVTDFIEYQSNKVCLIGICGMGESGKTTTAKSIYNQIHWNYMNKSFIGNVREVCEENNEIIQLQQQLLLDITNTNVMIHSIASREMMINNLYGTKFLGKAILVILDDVTAFYQLKALCANPRLFGPGSVFIVTTRDVHLLKLVRADYVCTMKELEENESLELFSWYAFRQPIPMKKFNKLSRNVVAYCGGLPLALEVLGSYLFERTKEEWITVLSKLKRIPNDQVQQKMRISYDALMDDTEKDIFLDICCFFIGKDRAYVTELLNGCGFHADIGIAVLVERSLVKIEKNNKLVMHDLIRDMGREIVRESSPREPGKCSRLSFHEDVRHILTTCKNFNNSDKKK